MLDVVVMKLPGAIDHSKVLFNLLLGQARALRSAMRADGHDVGCAVREPDACAAQSDLHHVAREVAGRMRHVLVCSSYLATRSVIVCAEMRGGHTPACRLD